MTPLPTQPDELERVLDYLDTGDPAYPGRRSTAKAAIVSWALRIVAEARQESGVCACKSYACVVARKALDDYATALKQRLEKEKA